MINPDTIFAVASGHPPAAIAIMRISGPSAIAAAVSLAGTLPPPRVAGVRPLRDPDSGNLLDRALVLVFAAPASATGEDLVELHLHGGRAVITAVSAALGRIAGLRPAVAGEFTRRALMAGRIDLAEAEGLGDLLIAQTEGQRRAAIATAEGQLSRAVAGWADRLLMVSAQVEAVLDFSDEDDVGDMPMARINGAVQSLADDVAAILATPAVERLRDGVRIVLGGPPNSGKSTLFNALVDRDAAIVSPIAGTTRDRIEAAVVREGIAYLIIDTAGLAHETVDAIEVIGIARAREAIAGADILLWLGDDAPPDHPAVIWLWPRADDRVGFPGERLSVSVATGEGMASLWAAIAVLAVGLLPREGQLALNERQRALCSTCLDALRRARDSEDLLLVAEHLRLARAALDHITGATHVEDMLDALFGRFCIGK